MVLPNAKAQDTAVRSQLCQEVKAGATQMQILQKPEKAAQACDPNLSQPRRSHRSVHLQSLDLAIPVRVQASQPNHFELGCRSTQAALRCPDSSVAAMKRMPSTPSSTLATSSEASDALRPSPPSYISSPHS